MHSPRPLCAALLAAVVPPAFGDYADDTGYKQLVAELGPAMLTGAGVGVTQVEAPGPNDAYLPEAGSGTFAGTGYWAGKTFTIKSGPGIYSQHADEVGAQMYGRTTIPGALRASMTPGVTDIVCWNANSWDDSFLSPSGEAPVVETMAVQNHSWILSAGTSSESIAGINSLLRRQDFSINRDNYVCCAGVNNNSLNDVPDLFAAAYNVISVGRSDGDHSRGGTTADMDGPGRRKPEIVAPLDFTSFSTAYVSSAAALMRQKANLINTASARRTKTIKAVLLAGATKEEFPAWAKTAQHPIDEIYGAGELNVYNSYHILDGGEQMANGTAALPHNAWDYHSLIANGSADYRLTIPAGSYGVELSAFIVWHRTCTDSPLAGFSLNPDPLIDFNLTLFSDPAASGTAVTLDSSTSTLYNLEHVWKKDLPSGNYRLRVTRGGGAAHDYAIAWRLSTAPHQPAVQFLQREAALDFVFPELLTGQTYKFQSSPDLSQWADIETFTASGKRETRTTTLPVSPRYFFRLLPVQAGAVQAVPE